MADDWTNLSWTDLSWKMPRLLTCVWEEGTNSVFQLHNQNLRYYPLPLWARLTESFDNFKARKKMIYHLVHFKEKTICIDGAPESIKCSKCQTFMTKRAEQIKRMFNKFESIADMWQCGTCGSCVPVEAITPQQFDLLYKSGKIEIIQKWVTKIHQA